MEMTLLIVSAFLHLSCNPALYSFACPCSERKVGYNNSFIYECPLPNSFRLRLFSAFEIHFLRQELFLSVSSPHLLSGSSVSGPVYGWGAPHRALHHTRVPRGGEHRRGHASVEAESMSESCRQILEMSRERNVGV